MHIENKQIENKQIENQLWAFVGLICLWICLTSMCRISRFIYKANSGFTCIIAFSWVCLVGACLGSFYSLSLLLLI